MSVWWVIVNQGNPYFTAVDLIIIIIILSSYEGESGLGKSTLINSLFLTDLYTDRKLPNAAGEILATISIPI